MITLIQGSQTVVNLMMLKLQYFVFFLQRQWVNKDRG